MNKKSVLLGFCFLIFISNVFSQSVPGADEMYIDENGQLDSIYFKNANFTALFNASGLTGPAWYLMEEEEVIELPPAQLKDGKWMTGYDYIDFSIEYKEENGRVMIIAVIKNGRNTPFQPTKAGIRLGINTYMDHYPDWEGKLFPTLLRCEKTHFWGYFMSPLGRIMVIASPDPIASWSHDYSKSWGEPPYWFWGHRITSVNLDLINTLPLPARHPQDLYEVNPGKTQTFRIYLTGTNKLDEVYPLVASMASAPVLHLERTSFQKGETVDFSVTASSQVRVQAITPEGKILEPQAHEQSFSFSQTAEEGLYYIQATDAGGKVSEASFYVRKNYEWYMQQAMKAVVDYPQKAARTHCESWYGFYTTYAGGFYFPENEYLPAADSQFQKILPIVFDTAAFEPHIHQFRIQNVSSIIGILVDRFHVYQQKADLHKALRFSEFLLKAQSLDGAYRAGGKTHYTSVIYIAKSLMELLEAMEPFRKEKPFSEAYPEIYASVKRAMDELALNRTNIQTEGEQTFEDGMTSCSALQLGQFALLQSDPAEREKYREAALYMLEQHQCLEQLLIPDARMRSGTLRFWEAQYDVLMANNFFNSPHGWSSWSTYANYYAYLLTGEEKYLIRVFNGLDAAMQAIGLQSGQMRWAFMVNPYVRATQINRNIEGATPLNVPGMHYNAFDYSHDNFIMGEEYVDMVSGWHFGNSNDNDVHEHFKCLAEVALGNAFVLERNDGSWLAFNCTAIENEGQLIITPAEQAISHVHTNFKSGHTISVHFPNHTITKEIPAGQQWTSKN